MYFNCFKAQHRAGRAGSTPAVLGVSNWALDTRARRARGCGIARYALSATREGASPHSCSRR
jgi:hypothetical protein